jgi:hypothetical protein
MREIAASAQSTLHSLRLLPGAKRDNSPNALSRSSGFDTERIA